MRQFRSAAWLFVLLCISSAAVADTVLPTGSAVPGEVVVKVRSNASANAISTLEKLVGAEESKRLSKLGSGTLWRMRARGKSAEALAKALQNNPNIEYAEPNYIVRLAATPNDPSFAQLWGLKNTAQPIQGNPGAAGADIDIESAWNVTTGSSAVVIGVVDTGIDYTHPDLAANMWVNPGGKGNPNCAAGTFGFNAINDTCNPMDDEDHGTHVAGTIGAVGNNSKGVTGVNWTTSLMALKFLGADGYGTTADAVAAIDFAIQAKIDGVNVRVLSNSWGGGPFSKALLDVINKANEQDILFVAAAGNDNVNNDTYPHYPSSYAAANVISVAATDSRDGRAYFSNYGPKSVHLGAPGAAVYSTLPFSRYEYYSGTSMATPHVTGVAALILAQNPSLTTAQVKSAILDNVDPIPSLAGITTTGGRLNAAKALGAPASPDFTLSIAPSSRTVVRGNAASYTVTVVPANGFTGSVELSVTGLPAGTTATFTPSSTTSTSTLTIVTSGTTPLSSASLTVTGSSGALTRSSFATLSTVLSQPLAPCPSFTLLSYQASASTSVAIADFNRDGKGDVIVTETEANRVRIRLSNNTLWTYPVGTAPLSAAAADFNGDGRLDVATANSGSNDVSILLANGDTSFQAAVAYGAGASPFSVATGDFNGDGKADLAVANNGSSNVSVLLGQGNGTFAAAVNYATASGPFWVTPADFDRDGRLDLAVANFNANNVSLLRGNGDGTFQTATTVAAGAAPTSIAAADFDRDGLLDLAVTNYSAGKVSVLSGNGNGTFDAAVAFTVGNAPASVAAGDVNGDGQVDLVVANSDSNTLSILRGNGGGFLAAISLGFSGDEPSQAAVGDVDGDGRLDIAVSMAGYYYGYGLAIYRNLGDCAVNCGAFAAAADTSVIGPLSVATGDFNGDGRVDVATINNSGNSVTITLGNGDGTFSAGATVSTGVSHGITASDFNRDGRLDLAVAHPGSNQVSILLGNGDGTFQTPVPFAAGSSPRALATGDFDRDGDLDLAAAAIDGDNVAILAGNGNGSFQAPATFAAGDAPESVAVGDFNRDGKLDLAVANSGSANVSVLLGNGDGTFQTATQFAAGTTPYAVVADDLTGDGRADLAVANAGSNNVSLLIGNGVGGFAAAVNFAVGTTPQALLAGDFNLDGRLDLAAANNGSNNISVLIGTGSGTFAAAVQHAVGIGPRALARGDFNRDGRADLVVSNGSSSTISILANICPIPDLTVTKTHSGSFTQGETGKTYTVTVTNAGFGPTSSAVTVADQLPAGLTATTIAGSGWTCTLAPLACSRIDALAPAASYPVITVTVKVAASAAASVTNTVTVTGGGEVNTANNSASDLTAITPATDVTLVKAHGGSFMQGATGRTYTLRVRNAGGLPTSGTITVTDQLPAGLTATAMSGTGWSCTLGTLTCTRNDALAGGTAFPAITLTVNVAADAPSQVVNTASVAGGGDANPNNNNASDPTVIWSSETCGSFAPPVLYAGGPSYDRSGMIVADLNGDGRADVAVAGYSRTMSTMMGLDGGTLAAPVNYTLSETPRRLAAGDLDNDGDTDLVVTFYASVVVLLNDGNGTFAPGVPYSAALDSGYALAIADLNGDGNSDVVTGAYAGVNVLFGNGNGTLGTPVTIGVGDYYPSAIAVADLDRNGAADLLVSLYGSLAVLLGNGSGGFAAPVQYTTSLTTDSIVVGDFNGDGNVDVVGTTYYSVTVLLGNGNGTLQQATAYNAGYGLSSAAAADLNADGKLDLLATSNSSGIVTLRGKGDGTFGPATSYYTGSSAAQVAVNDFNRDGKPDLVFAQQYGGSVGIMLGGCADLTITKSHTGTFIGGKFGTYTLAVRSTGAYSNGTVTVRDFLPEGLTANSIYGSYNWACDLATLTCTTNSALSSDESTITVYVSVSASAPTSVTNTATVSGGSDSNPSNNTATDPTTIVHAPDLLIRKTHVGTFSYNQSGVYTITVGNVGTGPTTGTVTVTDQLPFGMTPTAMTGTGWNCVLQSRTCTREDSLAITQTYPPITLTVAVSSSIGSNVTNVATVSGGGDSDTSNNTAYDQTSIVTIPFVTATAQSGTRVNVTWNAVQSATTYEVWRSVTKDSFAQVATTISNSYIDTSVTPQKSYRYMVRAVQGSVMGPFSQPDIATTVFFTDDPLIAGSTPPKAVHMQELQLAINALRGAASLSPATFTTIASGAPVLASHINELTAAMNQARAALGLSTFIGQTPGAVIRGWHISDLRAAVK